MGIIKITCQNNKAEINIPFIIWNNTTNEEFNDQKYFTLFDISFEKRFIMWDFVTKLWNKLTGARNNLYINVSWIFRLKLIKAYTIIKLLTNIKTILIIFVNK